MTDRELTEAELAKIEHEVLSARVRKHRTGQSPEIERYAIRLASAVRTAWRERDEARAAGAAEERARVVAWLRAQDASGPEDLTHDHADAIERVEHLEEG